MGFANNGTLSKIVLDFHSRHSVESAQSDHGCTPPPHPLVRSLGAAASHEATQ